MNTKDLLTVFESELDIITAISEQFNRDVDRSKRLAKGDITYSLEVLKGSYERIVEALKDLR